MKPTTSAHDALALCRKLKREIKRLDDKRKYESAPIIVGRLDLDRWERMLLRIEERLEVTF